MAVASVTDLMVLLFAGTGQLHNILIYEQSKLHAAMNAKGLRVNMKF